MILAPLNSSLATEGFNGLYAGINAGYVDADYEGREFNGAIPGYTFDLSPDGGLIGGFFGFNHTLDNNFLLGIEADYELRDADDKKAEKNFGVIDNDYTTKSQLEDAASLRARLGYVFNDQRSMIYATGGYAAAKVKSTYNDVAKSLSDSTSKWHHGWTLGLGVEHFFSERISARAEYRYTNYSSENTPQIDIVEYGRYRQNLENEQSIRAGVMYHF